MQPYGLKRNWNATEDWRRHGQAERKTTRRKKVALTHRIGRRTAKQALRLQMRTASSYDGTDGLRAA